MDLTICGESGLLDDKYHFVEDRGGWIITSFGQSTYVVRIRSSLLRNDRSHGYWDVGFIESDQLVVTEYVFDDIWPDLPSSTAGILGKVLFTENIATRLLEDFEARGRGMEHLLVHCSRGKNRSPAVAMVLNKIYDLGANDADLREQYREDANWYVYRTLIETAKKRGLI